MRVTDDLATPPNKPIPWVFYHEKTNSSVTTTARTFFEARRLACLALGAAPEDLKCFTKV